MAAEVLGISYEDVHMVTGDTDTTMFDVGNHASGGCYQMGNAVINAATELRKKLLEAAAGKLGVDPDVLAVGNRQVFVADDPQKTISIESVVKQSMYSMDCDCGSECFSAKGSFNPDKNPPPFGVVFAEVDVDTETGVVDLTNLLYLFDCGRAINPTTVEGQLEGAAVQAIGYTLTEEYITHKDTGALLSDNFTTYKLPSALDIPEIDVLLHSTPVPSGPFGAKGVGQGAMIAVIPAIANAVYDATGVMITDMPATPEKIFEAMQKGEND
jgi:xanthine dehydrogenase molybdenum-binding subunit